MIPAGEQPQDSVRVSLLFGALFGLGSFGGASVAIVLPAMGLDLGVDLADTAWAISLYVLLLAIMNPIYGRLADHYGVKIPLVSGIVLLAAASVAAALSPNFAVLLVARIVQGIGAAAVPTLSLNTIDARYGGVTRAAALGRVTAMATAVTCLGPLTGGIVEHFAGWRAVLALPALGILFLPLIWRVLPTHGVPARLDIAGAVLFAAVSAGIVLLVQSPAAGLPVAALGGALIVCGAPLVYLWVRRRPDGFMPLTVISNGAVMRSSLAALPMPAAWFAILIATPAVLLPAGWEAWQVGLLLLPSGAVALLVPPFVGPALQRLGPRRTLGWGCIGASLSLVIASVGVAGPWPAALTVAASIVGVSFGFGQPALMAAVTDAVPAGVRGVAIGVAAMLFMLGGSVGSAFLAGFTAWVGMPHALALLALLPLVATLVLIPARRRAPRAPAAGSEGSPLRPAPTRRRGGSSYPS